MKSSFTVFDSQSLQKMKILKLNSKQILKKINCGFKKKLNLLTEKN